MNIIKVREDKAPIEFEKDETKECSFKVKEGNTPSKLPLKNSPLAKTSESMYILYTDKL